MAVLGRPPHQSLLPSVCEWQPESVSDKVGKIPGVIPLAFLSEELSTKALA